MSLAILGAGVLCGLSCALSAWAGVAARRRHERDRARREVAVRGALYRSLAEPSQSARIMDDLDVADRKLLEAKTRAVLPALRGEDRETLAMLLEQRGATEVARRKCRSRKASARAAACRLLGDVGSSYAVLDLIPLLDDRRSVVRLAAARALGRLGQPTGVVPLMQAVERDQHLPVDLAADAIQGIRDWPISLVQPGLSSPSERARTLSVELLGRLQVIDGVEVLVDLLASDPSPAVRARAARALGLIGSPNAVDPLIDALHAESTAVRAEAVTALGRLGTAAAVPGLRSVLLGPSWPLSGLAATALSALKPDGVAALREFAADQDHPAGAAARQALAGLDAGSSHAVPKPSTFAG